MINTSQSKKDWKPIGFLGSPINSSTDLNYYFENAKRRPNDCATKLNIENTSQHFPDWEVDLPLREMNIKSINNNFFVKLDFNITYFAMGSRLPNLGNGFQCLFWWHSHSVPFLDFQNNNWDQCCCLLDFPKKLIGFQSFLDWEVLILRSGFSFRIHLSLLFSFRSGSCTFSCYKKNRASVKSRFMKPSTVDLHLYTRNSLPRKESWVFWLLIMLGSLGSSRNWCNLCLGSFGKFWEVWEVFSIFVGKWKCSVHICFLLNHWLNPY